MRNNRQDILTLIRMSVSVLGYIDEDLKKLFGKTLKQISKLSAEELKPIHKELLDRTRTKTEDYTQASNAGCFKHDILGVKKPGQEDDDFYIELLPLNK